MPEEAPERGASEAVRKLEARHAAFLRAGFAEAEARVLAGRSDIAYLDALALVRAGFPPELAASILCAGDRPVY